MGAKTQKNQPSLPGWPEEYIPPAHLGQCSRRKRRKAEKVTHWAASLPSSSTPGPLQCHHEANARSAMFSLRRAEGQRTKHLVRIALRNRLSHVLGCQCRGRWTRQSKNGLCLRSDLHRRHTPWSGHPLTNPQNP